MRERLFASLLGFSNASFPLSERLFNSNAIEGEVEASKGWLCDIPSGKKAKSLGL